MPATSGHFQSLFWNTQLALNKFNAVGAFAAIVGNRRRLKKPF
jgi:hypothetical protein